MAVMARTHVFALVVLCPGLLVTLASAAAGFSCPPTYKPADACTAGPCRCAIFQTVRIQTNASSHNTEIIIRVTNKCTQPVYYVQFSLDSADQTTSLSLQTPTAGSTYTGSSAYQWKVSTVNGGQTATATTPALTWIRFTPTSVPNNDMMANTGKNDYEDFRFVVKNYSPIFPWCVFLTCPSFRVHFFPG